MYAMGTTASINDPELASLGDAVALDELHYLVSSLRSSLRALPLPDSVQMTGSQSGMTTCV